MIYFTADWHVFHPNIMDSCNRHPIFKDCNVMGQKLVDLHNEVVGDDDEVWHLGDLTMVGPNQIRKVQNLCKQLNRRKHFVWGNHDRLKPQSYIRMGFESFHTSARVRFHWPSNPQFPDCYLIHDPAKCVHLVEHEMVVCGHVHHNWVTKKLAPNVVAVNVGVDMWDYRPVSILQIFKEWERSMREDTFVPDEPIVEKDSPDLPMV